MDNQFILIVDSDAKNLQILKDNLEASGFLVSTVHNGKDAWEEILRTPPNLIISETNLPGLSGYQLLERINGDPKTSSIPLIFLTKEREVQQRIKGFELGAKDYLVKPLHVKEVIAHVRMVLRRIEQRKIDQIETYKKFSGKLNQLALADLIESFGIERKTGVLTVSNGKRTGQVFFREGSVVNAGLEDFKTEQAIYQMLPWQSGFFNMIFRDVDVADKISVSNLGLLLQGLKRLEIREKLINQLPSSKTAFTVSTTFKMLVEKKKVGNGANGFITLFDGMHDVEQIVDESKLDDLIALKRLVRLYQQGFIKPTIAVKKQPEPIPTVIEPAEKVTFIKKHEIPLEINLDKANTPPLESSEIKNHIIIEHTDKQEQSIQDINPKENNGFVPAPEDNTIEEAIPGSKLIIESTLGLEEKDRPKIPKGHVPPLFDEPGEEDRFVLKPSPLENQVDYLTEKLSEKPAEKDELEIENLEVTQETTGEPKTPNKNMAPPAFEEKDSNDNIFQIKPKSDQKDLEKEIVPLIEQIEQDHKILSENEKEQNKETEEFPLEVTLADSPLYNQTLHEPQDKKIEEPDFTFIDEELLKQSSKQMKQERANSDEFKKIFQPTPGIAQETEKPVVAKLSSEQDKLVLISIDEDCKDEIMDILTNDNFKSINISAEEGLKFDLGKIHFKSFSKFNLVAVSVEKNLNSFFKSVKQSVAGNIFAFDCSRPETWEYTSYLIHSIWFKFRIPYVVAVLNFKEQTSITMEVIRYKLDLKENITMVAWDEADNSIPEKLLQAVIVSTGSESFDAIAAPEVSPIQ
ncbi:response regulator [candidate division KSB1 bacterium]|nr:response regulator [candidate division KSB1 bacterium]MBL7093491.1 response regulator [candidate division KSB1 bacterium]